MPNKKTTTPLSVFACCIFGSCSPAKPSKKSVPHSVEKYLRNNGTDFIHYKISDLGTDNSYNYYEQSYNVYEEIETSWLDYLKVAPGLAFNSRIIDFGVVFNPEDSTLYSAGDSSLPLISEGQIYILNLKFLGFIGIPIAFKVNKINSEKKMIEFIYLKNNICNGFQRIYLNPDCDSKGIPFTRIDHVSFFKTGSNFIDKFIYPSFHRKTANDFHKNVFKLSGRNWESS